MWQCVKPQTINYDLLHPYSTSLPLILFCLANITSLDQPGCETKGNHRNYYENPAVSSMKYTWSKTCHKSLFSHI